MRRARVLVPLLLLATAAPLAAQQTPVAETRVEFVRRSLGRGELRAADGSVAGSVGILRTELALLLQASDSAAHYARLFQREHRTGGILAAAGAAAVLVIAADYVAGDGFGLSTAAGAGYLAAGGVALYGISRRVDARMALARSVNWYNFVRRR